MVGSVFTLRKSLRGMDKNFRMPQERFEKLFTDLRPYIQNSNGFRDPVSVEKQVAATLCYLADEGTLEKITNSFGIEKLKMLKTFYFLHILKNSALIDNDNLVNFV